MAHHLMREAALLYRFQDLRMQGVPVPHAWSEVRLSTD
jgi:hypothetical protein